jgi:hypothetical protein
MKYKGHLMMGLIGLALLAAPITASAQNPDGRKYDSHQSQSKNDRAEAHSYTSPSRSNGPARNVAPATEDRNARSQTMRNESRNEGANRTASNDRDNGNRDRDYRNYGNRDYGRDYGRSYDRDYDGRRVEGYYVMPRGYAGGACAWARHLREVYYHDRATGHPAAAADLLPQLHNAERNCGGVPYGFLR